MPYYIFKHPNKELYTEIKQQINEEHIYVDENGIKWDRIFTSPKISIDSKIDPYSSKAFIQKTNKNGTLGELYDLSKEMSEKRGGKKNDPMLNS